MKINISERGAAMQGDAKLFIHYLQGSDKHFVIPVYQRNYDWEIDQCKQLYNDLISTIKTNRKAHFFGSIVSVYNSRGKDTEFLIIDGQQRITTVSLILLAMHNILKKGIVGSKLPYLEQQIYEDFLVNKFQPEEKRIKLKPVKNDQMALLGLFGEETDYIQESKVTRNYQYFYDRILRLELTIDEVYDAICKLMVIEIKLDPVSDNAQLIFESLNSTGLALSEGDKIRNYVLMNLSPSKQESYYEKYWHKIEKHTNFDVSSFVRDYLTVKMRKIPNNRQVYFRFKDFFEEKSIEIEKHLAELLKYARFYEWLLQASSPIEKVNQSIERLNRLETSVAYPYFLEVFDAFSRNEITDSIVLEIFNIVEVYWLRRFICDLPSNGLNKVFMTLHRDVAKYDTTLNNYTSKLKYILNNKKGNIRFPDDSTFITSLSTRDIYNMQSKNKLYLLERLENGDNLERIDVVGMIENGKLSVEHIMPQTLTPSWKEALGNDYQVLYNNWINRLPNLTLTAYNSKYSNKTFLEKRDMEYGFAKSGLRMNQQIAKFNKWTQEELEARNQELIKQAMMLWPQLSTDFVPCEKDIYSASLEDDFDFTGKKATSFEFLGTNYKVENWTDLYQKVLGLLHELDSTILYQLANGQIESDLRNHVKLNLTDTSDYFIVDENLYVFRHMATQSKLNTLKRFFKVFGMEESELSLFAQDAPDGDEKNDQYDDLNKRFWEALLNEMSVISPLFSNSNPGKGYWLSAASGKISGMAYTFIIGKRLCAVQFDCDNTSKEINKKVFDTLKTKKIQIEATYGSSLIWERNDEKKSSKIRFANYNANIYNEDTWPQIRSFLIKSMLRLHDSIQPTLETL